MSDTMYAQQKLGSRVLCFW